MKFRKKSSINSHSLTSGVDPIARRQIWDLIEHLKPGKIIIFTTHHLDEAEILSDKLVIVHQGSLLASGTVSDLKNKFGGTYVIKLIIPSIFESVMSFDFSVFTIFKLLNKPAIQSREIVPYKEADPFL